MHRDLKILQEYKISVAEIAFEYDAMGHRVSKLEKTATGEEKKTLYSLDAQGNTMATYHYTKSSTGLESLSMGEWTIYGSKRIGIEQGSGVEFNPIKKINNTYVGNNIWDEAEWEEIPVEVYPPWQIGTWDEPNQVIGQKYEHSEGDKRYELANHLGNVLNVVTDRKLPVDIPLTANSPQGDGIVDYFTADVVSYSDYLPFGQVMPNRHGDDNQYRYGYQGKERVDEMEGDGNAYDFGARLLDVRLGRWLSVDPEFKMYPQFSPYNFALNVPISIADQKGLYATDKDGNIIFTPSGKPEWRWQGATTTTIDPNTGEHTISGIGYTAQKGYIYTDAGKKVEVYLVTNKTVYEATQKVTFKENNVPVVAPVEKGSPIDKYNATTNCTGDCFVDGKFVLYSDNVTAKFLKNENYSPIGTETPQAGDIGLYTKNGVVQHAEEYEKGGTVISKGGVNQKVTGQEAKSTWSDYDNYKVVRKSGDNKIVSGVEDKGTVDNGIRIVSKKEFKTIGKQIKSE